MVPRGGPRVRRIPKPVFGRALRHLRHSMCAKLTAGVTDDSALTSAQRERIMPRQLQRFSKP